MYYLHPTQNVVAFHQYLEMGEIAYAAERKRQAVEFIKEDPVRFVKLCVMRFFYYWGGVPRSSEIWQLAQFKNSMFLTSSILCFWGLGLAIHKRKPGAWLFFWLILLYPLVYYMVFTHARYRHPIEPEIGIVAVYLLSEVQWRPKSPPSAFPAQ
jgi:hypothetical protein